MVFPITTLVLAGCLAWARLKGKGSNALLLALCAWGVGVLAMTAPIFTFAVPYSLGADAFTAGCLLASTICYSLVRARPRDAPAHSLNLSKELLLVHVLGGVGALGCLVLLLNKGVNLSPAYLVENLATIRSENFEALEDASAGSPVQFWGTLFAGGSIISVIAAARVGRTGGHTIVALGVLNFVLITAVGLFVYAGRTTLFYAIGLVLISFYVSHRRVLTVSVRGVVLWGLLLVTVWYFAVSWVQKREGSINPESTLVDGQRANYRPWLAPLARGNDALGVGLVSVGYLASPLPTLAFYFEQHATPGPFWGGYSFPLQTRAVQKLTWKSDARPWIEIRREVFAPLESAGYFGNVWATWLRDLLVDFGYFGAVVFCGLFGSFMAWARNAYEHTGALHYHCFEVLACFTFAYGAFAGILFFTFLSTAYILALALMLAVRLTVSPIPRTHRTGVRGLWTTRFR